MKIYIENKEYNIHDYDDYKFSFDDIPAPNIDLSEPVMLILAFGLNEDVSFASLPIDEIIEEICNSYGIDKELIFETGFNKYIGNDYENDVMFVIRNIRKEK